MGFRDTHMYMEVSTVLCRLASRRPRAAARVYTCSCSLHVLAVRDLFNRQSVDLGSLPTGYR